MNNAMSCLLTTQASLDALWQRLISDTETTLHQNEAKAIQEVKTCCTASIHEAEALHAAAIREAETTHSISIMEAEEGACMTAVREAEAACVAHAFALQQVHGETMWALESDAIKEEGWGHQSFLQACGALQACLAESLGVLMYPIQLLTGNMSLTALLTAAPQQTISPRGPIPLPYHSKRATMAAYSTGTKWATAHLDVRWDYLETNPHHAPKSQPNEGERRKIPWQGA